MIKEWDRSVESIVTIYKKDGEIVEIGISAGPGIAAYLARQAGVTGILSLWHRRKSAAYPTDGIDHWEVESLADWQERQPHVETSNND